jgi:hypothetical protein
MSFWNTFSRSHSGIAVRNEKAPVEERDGEGRRRLQLEFRVSAIEKHLGLDKKIAA